jgi:hypothetical protein
MATPALDKFVETMTGILQSAKDFTLEQAPDILRQVVVWKRAEETAYLALTLLILVGTGIAYLKLFRWTAGQVAKAKTERGNYKTGFDDYGVFMFGSVAAGIICPISTITALCRIGDTLQVWLAPKVYLIEYFSHLIKPKC